MQTPIEIRYEGTVIGTATSASGSLDDGTLYLTTADPMPVGTKLELGSGRETTQVRVVRVTEADAATGGMIVRALSASEPLELSMPPVAVVPPRPAMPGPAPSARPLSSTPARTPSFSTPAPRPAPVIAAPPAPAAPPAAAAAPGGPGGQRSVTGEINRPSQTMPVVRDEAVPEPVGGDDSLNGTSGSVQVEVSGQVESSGLIETETHSTAELPAVGNGANRRRRNRRSKR